MATIDLGVVTAYAYAVAGGYTGTEQEFEELLGNIATDLAEIENLTVTANTLPAGSSATASYSNGVLTLGIPKGDKGDKGDTGSTGATGATGNGIASITLTSTVGAVHTYTITYTNGQTTTFDVTDGEVTTASLTATLADYARIDGYYEDLTAGSAEELISNVGVIDTEAYNFRPAGGSAEIGNRAYNTWVGGSLAINQAVANDRINFTNTTTTDTRGFVAMQWRKDSSPYTNIISHDFATPSSYSTIGQANFSGTTQVIHNGQQTNIIFASNLPVVEGHKYFFTMTFTGINTQEVGGVIGKNFNVIDLTLLFGTTIADYIYNLETGQAGAGVAWFKNYFPTQYYPYNAGGLEHVTIEEYKTNELNQWDEDWEVGTINVSNGATVSDATTIRSKNYCDILPSTAYYMTCQKTDGGNQNRYYLGIVFYDADKTFISGGFYNNMTFTTPTNARYFKIMTNTSTVIYGSTYHNDICISLYYDDEYAGVYEPFKEHVYPLDDSIVLRGIPKQTDDGRLEFDGDTWEDNGTITRKYGIVDLGTLSWTYSGGRFSAAPTGIKILSAWNGAGINCAKYSRGDVQSPPVNDKVIGVYSNKVYVADSAYTDAQTFKTAMSGVYLVYELATPTTEQAPSFTSPQIVHNIGTEELVGSSIPVGHNTKYLMNIKAMVEASPQSPTTDGDYIMRRQNGQNMYVALASTSTIQDIISRLEALEA